MSTAAAGEAPEASPTSVGAPAEGRTSRVLSKVGAVSP